MCYREREVDHEEFDLKSAISRLRKSIGIYFIFFLLLVQKKERKKSTPAMIYGHCRTPWLDFSTTVNCAKQFLSSASTINENSFFTRSLAKLFSALNLPAPFPPTNWMLFWLKKAEAGTAPLGVSNSTKQADSDCQYNQEFNYNLFECLCALACRPAEHRAGLDFFS